MTKHCECECRCTLFLCNHVSIDFNKLMSVNQIILSFNWQINIFFFSISISAICFTGFLFIFAWFVSICYCCALVFICFCHLSCRHMSYRWLAAWYCYENREMKKKWQISICFSFIVVIFEFDSSLSTYGGKRTEKQ